MNIRLGILERENTKYNKKCTGIVTNKKRKCYVESAEEIRLGATCVQGHKVTLIANLQFKVILISESM